MIFNYIISIYCYIFAKKFDMTNLHKAFRTLADPRIRAPRKHNLPDIIILSILAVLCGAESWDSIELFGKSNLSFLKNILQLPNGIPSHDTINRVISMLNPVRFERLFISWAQGLKDDGIIENVIAIDGKTVRGSKDTFHHRSPLHVVNAWSVASGLCLGQCKTDGKSNEITAIPVLLKMLSIEKSIITIDAIGTQRSIAEEIVERKADYILAVKANQKTLQHEVISLCATAKPVSDTTVVEKGHGRIIAKYLKKE